MRIVTRPAFNGNESNSATDSGAAYVFVRNGTNWSQQAYLKASNTDVLDDFGASVAVSGDTATRVSAGRRSFRTAIFTQRSSNGPPA